MITQSQLKAMIDYNPETGEMYWRERKQGRKFGLLGSLDGKGHLRICINGKQHAAHRLAWLYVHGEWPKDQIDHINCVKTDNRIANLREATNAENMRNVGKQSNNTSGIKGVSWHKHTRKWRATIKVDGKSKHLGLFDCPELAALVYSEHAEKLHGEFARIG